MSKLKEIMYKEQLLVLYWMLVNIDVLCFVLENLELF